MNYFLKKNNKLFYIILLTFFVKHILLLINEKCEIWKKRLISFETIADGKIIIIYSYWYTLLFDAQLQFKKTFNEFFYNVTIVIVEYGA